MPSHAVFTWGPLCEHRPNWKHYLLATSLASGNNSLLVPHHLRYPTLKQWEHEVLSRIRDRPGQKTPPPPRKLHVWPVQNAPPPLKSEFSWRNCVVYWFVETNAVSPPQPPNDIVSLHYVINKVKSSFKSHLNTLKTGRSPWTKLNMISALFFNK